MRSRACLTTRCRASEPHRAQRGARPARLTRPNGPGTNRSWPQMLHIGIIGVELASFVMRRDFKIKLIAAALVIAALCVSGEPAAARPPVDKPSAAEMLCSIIFTEARN